MQPARRALSRAFPKAGVSSAARIAMMAMTTRSSTSVNPASHGIREPFVLPLAHAREIFLPAPHDARRGTSFP